MKNTILAIAIGVGAYFALPSIALSAPLVFVLGLVLGWNVLEQPAWIAAIYANVAAKIKEIQSGV